MFPKLCQIKIGICAAPFPHKQPQNQVSEQLLSIIMAGKKGPKAKPMKVGNLKKVRKVVNSQRKLLKRAKENKTKQEKGRKDR